MKNSQKEKFLGYTIGLKAFKEFPSARASELNSHARFDNTCTEIESFLIKFEIYEKGGERYARVVSGHNFAQITKWGTAKLPEDFSRNDFDNDVDEFEYIGNLLNIEICGRN